MKAPRKQQTNPPKLTFLLPAFGSSFWTTAVKLADNDEQLAVPHCHSFGQQSPPTLGAQLDQPEAQLPTGAVTVAAAPAGTITVTPPLIIVSDIVTGQDVVSQSLPVLQQPPP